MVSFTKVFVFNIEDVINLVFRRMVPKEKIKDMKLKQVPGFHIFWNYSPFLKLLPEDLYSEEKEKQFRRYVG